MGVLVEIAVDTLHGALAAEAGGAGRVELCAALPLDGLTPSAGLIAAVRRRCRLPLHVLVRPRAGRFTLDVHELSIAIDDIARARDLGADGIVAGALTTAGTLDRAATGQLVEAAAPLPLVFHRAIDRTADPVAACAELRALRVTAVLSSGGAAHAVDGVATLARMVASGRPMVIAGGGVRPENVAAVVAGSGVAAIHMGLRAGDAPDLAAMTAAVAALVAAAASS